MKADKPGPSFIRTAHGAARKGGVVIVAEGPPLDEIPTMNASDTARGLAFVAALGKPFTGGNQAARNRGAVLTRTGTDLDSPDATKRTVNRRAERLRRARVREERVRHGGVLSTAVQAEIASWALATAWSRHWYSEGDAVKGGKLAEAASAHLLKAIGIAEREAIRVRSARTSKSYHRASNGALRPRATNEARSLPSARAVRSVLYGDPQSPADRSVAGAPERRYRRRAAGRSQRGRSRHRSTALR